MTLQTSLGELAIAPAKPVELNVVMEIFDEAAAWLHARGITGQWPSPMPERAWQRMEREIAKGEVYLARLASGDAIGVFRFEWNDPELWHDDPEGGGYVHSFAIRNGARGHGVGAAMIGWAKQYVRARGKKFLRLDCPAMNEPLREHYARLGFIFRGVMHFDDGDADALWEMQV